MLFPNILKMGNQLFIIIIILLFYYLLLYNLIKNITNTIIILNMNEILYFLINVILYNTQ